MFVRFLVVFTFLAVALCHEDHTVETESDKHKYANEPGYVSSSYSGIPYELRDHDLDCNCQKAKADYIDDMQIPRCATNAADHLSSFHSAPLQLDGEFGVGNWFLQSVPEDTNFRINAHGGAWLCDFVDPNPDEF